MRVRVQTRVSVRPNPNPNVPARARDRPSRSTPGSCRRELWWRWVAPAAAAAWARRLALAVPPSCQKAGRLARRKMPPPMLVPVAPRNIRSRFRWREEFLVTRHRRPRSRSARTRTAAEAGQKLCSSTFGPRLLLDAAGRESTRQQRASSVGGSWELQRRYKNAIIGGYWRTTVLTIIDFLWLVHVMNDNN